MLANLTSLSLPQKVGQLFFIGIPGLEIDDATRRLLDEVSPGGICLFARNIREAGQTRELVAELKTSAAVEPFISIDQEGGLVDRLRRVVEPMPSADKLRNVEDGRRHAKVIAESLTALGITMDFAPVVDVIDERRSSTANGLYSRAFGNDAREVTRIAGAFLDELQRNGVIGCLKHFPGLGASAVDSHESLPSVEISDDEMSDVDLLPYRELIASGGVGMVMSAHATFPNSRLQERDSDGRFVPASLSRNFVSRLLREEMNFDGIAITDDLEMGAIVNNYGMGATCVAAINAGEDMLAICADPEKIRQGFEAVLGAVDTGTITESRIDESLQRIAAVKNQIPHQPASTVDFDRISEEIRQFTAELSR
jgi:beta-N-acetylhexosaminidase